MRHIRVGNVTDDEEHLMSLQYVTPTQVITTHIHLSNVECNLKVTGNVQDYISLYTLF